MRAMRTQDGKVKCPYCLKVYHPILEMPDKEDTRSMQKIYPKTKRWEREQLITGICCDRCWDSYLGVLGNTYTDEGERTHIEDQDI